MKSKVRLQISHSASERTADPCDRLPGGVDGGLYFPRAMIAALFVERGGVYWDLPDVDPWDEARDARLYPGPWPVVAHPPCARWCRLAGLVEARWGHARGDDGGCFAAALAAVRRWGGVLEHPAYSDAWPAFGLPVPPRSGGWVRSLFEDGWACHIEQVRYGHRAKKATWLYACCVPRLPLLRWGSRPDVASTALVSWCGNHTNSFDPRPRIGRAAAAAAATPESLRDGLISIARSVPVELQGRAERAKTPPPMRDLLVAIARSVPRPHAAQPARTPRVAPATQLSEASEGCWKLHLPPPYGT